MFRFSQLQMQQFPALWFADETRFASFVLRTVGKTCRDGVREIDPQSLREMVNNGMARARSHGLTSPKNVTAFVAIMFEIGPNFDEQAEIRAALADRTVPIEVRFDTMLQRVPDAAWTEAEDQRRSPAWFPELDTED